MPTIQLKITYDEFAHFQSITGETTATKAIKKIISEYERLSELYPKEVSNHRATRQELDNLDNAIINFSTALNRLIEISGQFPNNQ